MAKNEWQLFCDLAVAKKQANDLIEVACKITSLANNDLSQEKSYLAALWTGEPASEFTGKIDRLREQLLARAKEIKKVAATIKSVAERTYKTEMKALQISRERKYKG